MRLGPRGKLGALAALLAILLLFFRSRPAHTGPAHATRDAGGAGSVSEEEDHLRSRLVELGEPAEAEERARPALRVLEGGGAAAGQSGYRAVLVHGADRLRQSARYWAPHFAWLARLGSFAALDLLGHGQARPGAADALPGAVPEEQQARAVAAALADMGAWGRRVLFARSYGARVLLDALALLPPAQRRVHALVLVAPALSPAELQLPPWAAALPALVLWARDDPVVPYARAAALLRRFERAQLYTFEDILVGEYKGREEEQWRGHCPENERPAEFQAQVERWLAGLR